MGLNLIYSPVCKIRLLMHNVIRDLSHSGIYQKHSDTEIDTLVFRLLDSHTDK